MSSIAFELGRLAGQRALVKTAGPLNKMLGGAGGAVGSAIEMLGPLLKGTGSTYGHLLKKYPASTLAASIPAAGAVGEGASYLGQLSGATPSTSKSWYAPHMSGIRYDPHISGWSAISNAITQPVQFAKNYLTGNARLPQGQERVEGYNPAQGRVTGDGRVSEQVNPVTGETVVTHIHGADPGVSSALRDTVDYADALRRNYLPQGGNRQPTDSWQHRSANGTAGQQPMAETNWWQQPGEQAGNGRLPNALRPLGLGDLR